MSILSVTIGNMRRNRASAVVYGGAENGGYFTGIIVDAGTRYRLILAPRIGGQFAINRRYKSTNNTDGVDCRTLTNGLNATNVMINANTVNGNTNYQVANVAQTARTALLSGKNDWYVPARDELELCYRNLKPSTDTNTNVARIGGYGGDGLGSGTNTNSDPVGIAYTTANPTQTPNILFQSALSEGFDTDKPYWSSTEADDQATGDSAWIMKFIVGNQYKSLKNNYQYTRLIRRVAA